MKGLVFTTFYDFCEERLGEEGLEDVIDAANLPHAGGYTSVGTYPFSEMAALVTAYVQRTGNSMPEVMRQFGEYCFSCWVKKFPDLFRDRDLFDVLGSIDDFHESEVRRLYPDAELPSFKITHQDHDHILLDYVSCKPLADLAEGVIRGAGRHLGCPVNVSFVITAEGTRFRVARVVNTRLAA